MKTIFQMHVGGEIVLFIPLKFEELRLVRNEISESSFQTIKSYYNKIASNKKYWLQRYIFNTVLCGNKYFFALLSSTLIGFSVDVLLDIKSSNLTEKNQIINSVFLFVTSIIFAFSMLLFFSKINQIQESAIDYIPDPQFPLKYEYIKIAQQNIIFSNCYDNIKYLTIYLVFCFVSGISTLVSLLFGTQIVNLIKECYECVINFLFNK